MIMQAYGSADADPEKAERKRCPFYGFYCSEKAEVFVEGNNNQCGALEHDYPCQMEVSGREVNFNNCELNNTGNIVMISKAMHYKFFPKGEKKGLDFDDWMEMVMK